MLQDLRHAIRILLKRPSFTILAVVALAVGIGANAAIFSVVQGVLLRPLPYKNADRLVFIRADFRGESGLPGIAPGEIADIQNQSKLIESIGWIARPSASLTDGDMEHVEGVSASDDFLPTLEVTPVIGRLLSTKDDEGSPHIRNLMISYELWQRRFHGDPNILGKTLEVNNYSAGIIGVLPPGFRLYFGNDTNVPPQIDIWFPAGMGGSTNRNYHMYNTVARLRPGVTIEQAQAEMNALTERMIQAYPKSYPSRDFRLDVVGLRQDVVKPVRTIILVLLGAVGFVLLIACANVANLLLARASGRKAEMALRAALGAGQMRVVRQVLTESVVLALIGGATGLWLAGQSIDLLLYLKPENLPRIDGIALNPTVTVLAFALSLISGILFGLAPAWHAAKMDIQAALNESGRSKASSAGGNKVRMVLVAAQVALSLILLVGAGLMIRTFENMRRVDLGFDPSNVLTMRLDYNGFVLSGADTWRFYKRAVEAIKNQPGVVSAGAANILPFGTFTWTDSFALAENPGQARTALFNPIVPGYFQTMRIPLVAGRDFSERDNDDAAHVAIVDQVFAQKTWPGENPIGKKIILDQKPTEIVGIARYTPFGIRPDDRPQLYVPYGSSEGFQLMIVVRTKTNPLTLAPLLGHTLEGLGGQRPVWDVRTMDDRLSSAMAETRFALILLGVLSTVAFMLSVIGIYGVVSYSTAERMHEFAIRIAVGAQPRDILKLALTWGLAPAIVGTAIGIAGAFALTRFLSSLLFNVSATDWLTYTGVSAVLLVAAFAACYIPIRTLALRADPRRFL